MINDLSIHIGQISLVHDFMLTKTNRCSYLQGRRYYGLVLGVGGEAEYCFRHGKYQIHEGEIAFVSSHAAYTINAERGFRHYTVNFDLDLGDIAEYTGALLKLFSWDITVFSPSYLPGYRLLFESLCQTWQEKAFGYRLHAASLLNELMHRLVCELTRNAETQGHFKRIQPALDLIAKNWNRPVSVASLAKECYMSPSTFRHLFTKNLNKSPKQYQNEMLVGHAKDYLKTDFFSISEVAEACGFSDINYFSRFFKTHTGSSPLQYRKQLK